MEKLSKDWITENHIDFEYKKYILLAYLQYVEKCFRDKRLYPPLAELTEHYRVARLLKENKKLLAESFPKRLTGLDAGKLSLKYESLINDDAMMEELESILDFSLEKFTEGLREGKYIYDSVEKEIAFDAIGIVPMDTQTGYLFLKNATAETRVYSYSVSIFEEAASRWRGLHTHYLRTYPKSLMHTFNFIKTEMIREHRELPNPACYAAETGRDVPVEETLLPIAKRMLIREVSK